MDTNGFREVVEANAARIFRLAYRMTGNEQDAEEVVQETFMKAYNNRERFDGRSELATWLYRIATNCALDLLRSRGRRPTEVLGEEPPADEVADAEAVLRGKEIRGQIQRELDNLAPKERAAFILRHFQQQSIAEISVLLDLKPNAVKQAIFRAVRKMRDALQTRPVS